MRDCCLVFRIKTYTMKFFIVLFITFFSLNSTAQEQFVVYFNSDKYELTKAENKKLNDWMTQHTKDKIVAINGYTDEDGSNGYNDTLAKKRVNHVFEIIKGKVPFREDFKSRSFGENFNQSKNKDENRKVTIYYIEEKDLARENEILGIEQPKTESIDLIENEEITEISVSDKLSLEEQITNAKVGDVIRIETINFHLNSKEIVKESMSVLYELLNIMQKNDNLVIQIQGHVCCNPNLDDKISLKLSKNRAKTIRHFLISNGISRKRVFSDGFGSSKPIFKIPENSYKEEVSNRRVEILILEN